MIPALLDISPAEAVKFTATMGAVIAFSYMLICGTRRPR